MLAANVAGGHKGLELKNCDSRARFHEIAIETRLARLLRFAMLRYWTGILRGDAMTATSDAAFRAQLVLSEQRQLYDYWCTKGGTKAIPYRADICPADIPRLLPNISLIEIECDPFRFRFRLAGTRIREIFDREVTGLYVNDFDWDKNRDYWLRNYRRIFETHKPAQGVIRGPGAEKDHLAQFWLRLPLRTCSRDPGMFLCHDAMVPAEHLPHRLQAAG